MNRIQIISILASLLLIYTIYRLVHRKKMREQYAILWFFTGAIFVVFSIFRGLLDSISKFMGIYYPPATLTLIIIFLGVLLAIHFSIVISKLTGDNEKLIQEIALLKHKIEKIETKIDK